MCAVRALTEGEPRIWWPEEPPASVQGIVLRMGEVPSQFAMYASDTVGFVDLWLGDMERVRVMAYGATLASALAKAAPTVGDALTVRFTGWGEIERGKHAGRKFRKFEIDVKRGHH